MGIIVIGIQFLNALAPTDPLPPLTAFGPNAVKRGDDGNEIGIEERLTEKTFTSSNGRGGGGVVAH